MTAHLQIRQALQGLAGDRVFPVVADEGAATPYIVFQILGGEAQEYLGGEKPKKQKRRVQLNTWSTSTLEAAALADQAEDALRAVAELQTEVLTIAADTYDQATKYRGTMQQFYLCC